MRPSPETFIVLPLMFRCLIHCQTLRSLIHFDLIFINNVRLLPYFFLSFFVVLYLNIQFSHPHLSKRPSFSHWIVVGLLLKTMWPHEQMFVSGLQPSVYMSLFRPVPHCFEYFSFVVSFETRKCDNSSFVLFQDGFDYSRPSGFHLNFGWIALFLPKKIPLGFW